MYTLTLQSCNQEMILFFNRRTHAHIARVRAASEALISLGHLEEDESILLRANVAQHDASKFSGEERVPYIIYSWYMAHPDEYELDAMAKAAFDRAWEHHWRHNNHHPEFWDMAPSSRVLEFHHLSPNWRMAIYHTFCDWIAMSLEFRTDPIKWMKSTVPRKAEMSDGWAIIADFKLEDFIRIAPQVYKHAETNFAAGV